MTRATTCHPPCADADPQRAQLAQLPLLATTLIQLGAALLPSIIVYCMEACQRRWVESWESPGPGRPGACAEHQVCHASAVALACVLANLPPAPPRRCSKFIQARLSSLSAAAGPNSSAGASSHSK